MGNWEKDQRLLWLVVFGISETMERYEILKEIGSGNFGVAKLARDKWTRELFAVKFIERGQKVCCFFSSTSSLFSVVYYYYFFKCGFWVSG